MLFNSPLSAEKADRLIALMELSPGHRVLDVGCGTGELLIRLMEATGVHGTGIDLNPEVIATAREHAAARLSNNTFTFHAADIRKHPLEDHSVDAAVCMGSTHAFGLGETAYPNALEAMTRLVRPGGQLLIGEGYWKREPAPEYLQLIGDPVGIYRDHAANVAFAEARGLTPLYATVSNDDEWDHFEWSHRLDMERKAAASPDDPALAERLKQSRIWRDGYLRWGRSTMGFGLYLFQTPR